MTSCRLSLVVILILMLSLPVIAICTPSIHASAVEDPPQHIHLTFQGDPASSTTVMWQTDTSTAGSVVLYDTISRGGDPEGYRSSVEGFYHTYDGASGYIHTVELTGLDADTLYFFVCGGPGNYSRERAFKTAPLLAVDVQFVVGGDSRTDAEARTRVSQALRFTNASFILHSGDMVEYGGTQSQWDSWFTDAHDNWITANLQTLPVIPCLGNHEKNATQYYAQFALPNNEQWYVYDWGPHLRIIVLNSEASQSQIAEDQVNWLERILYETPNDRWKIVMLHRSIYYSGSHRNATDLMQSWVPLFDKYHVDLVIQGHTHHYHRTLPLYNHTVVSSFAEGTLYLTSGGWGAPLLPYREQPYSAFGRSIHHLVVVDSFQNGTLVLTAIDVNGDAFDTIRLFKAFDDIEPLYRSPLAVAGPDQTVDEDSIVTFDGTKSLNSTEITSYHWTFMDESPQTLSSAQPQYQFSQPGVYLISLNITDATGNSAIDALTVTVQDITVPVANAGNPLTGIVNTPITFDASGSHDNVGIISYDWDFGDGQHGTTVSESHTYSLQGNFTVTLTVQDAAGNLATDTVTIFVESAQGVQPWMLLAIGGTIAAIVIGVYVSKVKR